VTRFFKSSRFAIGSAALLLSANAFALPADPGEDWPQWRGPKRDGSVSAATLKRLPKEWPAAAPAPAWSSFVGEGYSSPVIADGRVYVMGREKNEETCLAFDAQTGSRLWRHAYVSDYVPPDPRAGSGPKSTPTVDGDRVYMLGLGGMFNCLDAKSGAVLWSHDLRKEAWGVEKDEEGVDKWFPVCGYASSVLADGNQVIVAVGGKKVGALAAYDRKSGKLLWHAIPERSSYGSPMVADLAGRRQIIGFSGLRMVSLDLAGQEKFWELPFPAMFEQTITTPVLYKDMVIVSGEQKPTIALRVANKDGKIEQKEAWTNSDLKAYMTTPVVFGDHMVGADSAGRRLVCVDLATGTTKWSSPRMVGHISLVVAGDKILTLTSKGELIVVAADAKEYKELAKWKVSEVGETWAYLAVAGSKVYVKDKEKLICFDLTAKG
jgi:outer membrane protein assembly factor BamB